MNDYRDYFTEVTQTLANIEQWFAGTPDRGVLERLLARFSPQFSMIAPNGNSLDIAALQQLFETLGGARPGLRIDLSDMRGLDQHAQGATLSYRELQSDASGVLNDRRATVVIEKLPSGKLLWRHLHETFCQ
ncbi:DUF4440 domain-containing protein [Pseudomonas sp. S04]|uniref:DUF4440 domain-containing protein n=1 Tax=unclassified Pseudomonas TaxID=196821 RepID=UPI00131FEFEA|nr:MULTISPECIES: DUF4440 domain-containing protein [unclassified Pseudomonas]QHC99691.1 DUF4440 domain-containing protein [Pseudomonas sp. S04]QHF32175.1 DUF4440 domain-containing protein [Pseudomonas sp. S19]